MATQAFRGERVLSGEKGGELKRYEELDNQKKKQRRSSCRVISDEKRGRFAPRTRGGGGVRREGKKRY